MHRVSTLIGYLLLVLTLCSVSFSNTAQAQSFSERSDTRWAHDTTYVVASLSLPDSTQQLIVEGPNDSVIEAVDILHYGTQPLPFDAESTPSTWRLTFNTPQQGPFDIVMRVRTGAASSQATWALTPLTGANRQKASTHRTSVAIQPSPPGRKTLGWHFPSGEMPRYIPSDTSPSSSPFSHQRPTEDFTLSLWMRTLTRNAVVASTWNGQSGTSYPLEITTDPAGRLHVYHGTSTAHHTLRTSSVIANGQWHHITIVYDAGRQYHALYIDGKQVAQARHPQRPTSTFPLTFGARPAANNGSGAIAPGTTFNSFRGHLAWVQLIPDALDADAIRGLRSAATPHEEAIPYGPWPERSSDDFSWHSEQVTLPLAPPTPVTDWQARAENENIVLSWTASHREGHYTVERSVDQRKWTELTTLAATEGSFERNGDRQYTARDEDPDAQVLFYRIQYIHPERPNQLSPVLKVGHGSLTESLEQPTLVGNFPNPFRSETTIAFELPAPSNVALTVWTIAGTHVTEITERTFAAGYHEVAFQAQDIPSGTYFIRMQTDHGIEAHRMVVLR